MARLVVLGILALLVALPASAADKDGLIIKLSPHGVKETMDRFARIAESKGITIFARVDHAAGATKIGDSLRPTELLIFGNPKLGTPLLKANQRIGNDLPLRLVAWRNAAGATYIGYTDPDVLAERYGLKGSPVFGKMAKALDGLTNAAIKQ